MTNFAWGYDPAKDASAPSVDSTPPTEPDHVEHEMTHETKRGARKRPTRRGTQASKSVVEQIIVTLDKVRALDPFQRELLAATTGASEAEQVQSLIAGDLAQLSHLSDYLKRLDDDQMGVLLELVDMDAVERQQLVNLARKVNGDPASRLSPAPGKAAQATMETLQAIDARNREAINALVAMAG